jgi:hypothetical protein
LNEEPNGMPSQPDRRGHERLRVLAEATLRRDGSSNYRVQVFDVSQEGCKVEIVERPSVGEGVWLRFDGLEAMHAMVSWVAPPLAGLRFDRPIHVAVFEALMKKLSGRAS